MVIILDSRTDGRIGEKVAFSTYPAFDPKIIDRIIIHVCVLHTIPHVLYQNQLANAVKCRGRVGFRQANGLPAPGY